jgi:outer membrane protein assembly factor BamB
MRKATWVPLLLACMAGPAATARDWPSWRGPEANGVSRESGLPETWTADGQNLLWKAAYGGRSTPIVMDGRVIIVNRAGEGATEGERVLCFDAETGKVLWEHTFGIFLTDIVRNRVGWASPAGDPETGNVYAYGVQGALLCLDRQGKLVWQRSLHEEYGVISGYGGRIASPAIDGPLVVISFLGSGWGAHGRGGHRYVAFDKRTGDVVWWSEPGGKPVDTTYSVPIFEVVNGTRLLIDGNGDGGIHAVKAATGEKVWDFALSQHGINSSLIFWNGKVFATHSEENLDSTAMGRVVCIDPTGKGDVTKTHEKWRLDGIEAGYSSPAIHDGTLYVIDNSANLHAIAAESGKLLWKHSVGTVMRSSPVVADGKIYVGEVNARFVILKPGPDGARTLSEVTFPTPDGKVIEVNGSPAVANGRIYFTTRDETYCLGSRSRSGADSPLPARPTEERPAPDEPATHVQVRPAEVVLSPGDSASFTARLYDAKGRFLKESPAAWTIKALKGTVSESGKLELAAAPMFAGGAVEAKVGGLTGEARVRVVPRLPFRVDFEDLEPGKPPSGWVGAGAKFVVEAMDGGKVLKKVANDFRFIDAETFIGRPEWSGYTIAADVRGSEKRRSLPNITLLNSCYQLILVGNQQRLRIVGWLAMPRLDKTISFAWKPDTWYRMKFHVEVAGAKGVARGKVWPRGEQEPEAWTIEVEDPAPYPGGSPGLQAYTAGVTARSAGADIFFDNLEVTPNSTDRQ